jgi:hypothetical protein
LHIAGPIFIEAGASLRLTIEGTVPWSALARQR